MTEWESYCRGKAAPEGSNLYYGTLFETPEVRSVLFSIFALHYEISECLTVSQDPGVTHIKLHWWAEELQRLLDKQPRHPVTRSILSFVDPVRIESPLKTYFAMLEYLISGAEIRKLSDWMQFYCEGYGQIINCAEIMTGLETCESESLKLSGGTILTLEMLQSAPLLLNKSYHLAPGELLDKYNFGINNLVDNSDPAVNVRIFETILTEIKVKLEKYGQNIFNAPMRLPLYHYCMNRIAMALCEEIMRDGHQILEHKIMLTPVRKLWIVSRTKLQASLLRRV